MKLKNIVYYWFPPLFWMALIFVLSSKQKISVGGDYFINFFLFKTIHIVEYALLYFLLFRAFYSHVKSFVNNWVYWIPIAISIVYAYTDELHQRAVATRQGTLRDVFIDTLGIVLMYIYIKRYRRLLRIFLK